MNKRNMSTHMRHETGGQLAEFGPGLLVLILSTFFPLILLINLGVTYGSGWTLNNLQLREAAVSKSTEAQSSSGNVMKNIPDTWKNAGMGRYCSLVSDPVTKVAYKPGQNNEQIVVVTTTIQTNPMLSGMNFASIPGLTTASTFTYQSEALMENPDDVTAQAQALGAAAGGAPPSKPPEGNANIPSKVPPSAVQLRPDPNHPGQYQYLDIYSDGHTEFRPYP